MTYWARDSTIEWIAQQENRIADIKHYLYETTVWSEQNSILNDEIVFACALMTVVWVAHMRNEAITKQEIFEILGIKEWDQFDNDVYALSQQYHGLDHIELLESIAQSF